VADALELGHLRAIVQALSLFRLFVLVRHKLVLTTDHTDGTDGETLFSESVSSVSSVSSVVIIQVNKNAPT
jgi:hypothetical protein